MKAIACAIVFAAIWHTPIDIWIDLTVLGKLALLCTGIVFVCLTVAFLITER